jgi:hypothetical protein
MQDLGLKERRKGNWFGETFVPMRSQDYKGVVGEFVKMVRERGKRVLRREMPN